VKKLEDILYKVRIIAIHGNRDVDVKAITIDSRKVDYHSMFIAVKGEKFDGHKFIDQALHAGASVIVCEDLPLQTTNATFIQVKNSHEATAYIAHNFYDEPSKELKLIGVTGTAKQLLQHFSLNYSVHLVTNVV